MNKHINFYFEPRNVNKYKQLLNDDVTYGTIQLGKVWGTELKIAELKLGLSGHSLAHVRAFLQAVAKAAVVDLF